VLQKRLTTTTLDMNTPSVQYLCKRDKRLAKVISMVGAITYTPHEDGYAFLVSEIIEQMLSTKAADKIYSRLEDLCEGNVCADSINNLDNSEIKAIGTSSTKVKYIRCLTDAIESGHLCFDELARMPDKAVTKALTSICGIGTWTAKMYLIFCLNRQDILPYEDVAFLQGYRWAYKTDDCSPPSIQKRCKKWKPYSSIASRYMYRALDTGLTKMEFHLYK